MSTLTNAPKAADRPRTQKTAVILMNLGTPDAPTPQAVRRYLSEFLSDKRVIEMPKLIWQIILRLFVLPTRPKRVAHAYKSIWSQDGSPLLAILKEQARLLESHLAEQGRPCGVYPATTYGNPNVKSVLGELQAQGVERFVVLPLYPQYSATSSAAAMDKVFEYALACRDVPGLSVIKDYHDHPEYITALADSVRRFWAVHGQPQKLVMSFHGIPKPYADRGDPYPTQCHTTARLLAKALGLDDDAWVVSFQSRFGAQEWIKPYTDVLLTNYAKSGVESVHIMSPAFSADCLETLEELAVENRENFLNAGGKSYAYIPALNTDPAHIALLAKLVFQHLPA